MKRFENDSCIEINKELAKYMTLNELVVFKELKNQLDYYAKVEENYIDGRYWVCNSIKDWREKYFYFLSEATIKRIFKKFEKEGLVLTAVLNKNKFDRTKWYSINYNRLDDFCEKRKIIKQIVSIKRTMAALEGLKIKRIRKKIKD